MKKRVLKVLLIGCIFGLLLTGCGSSFPEMTEEEHDQYVQYAVSLLMKYSNNGVEKLSSLSSLELERQMKKEAREATKAARDAENAEAIANMKDELSEEGTDESEEALSVEDTPEPKETDLAEADIPNPEDEPLDDTGKDEAPADEGEPLDDGSSDDSDLKEDIDALLDKFGDDLDAGIEQSGIGSEKSETEDPDKSEEGLSEDSSNTDADMWQPTDDGEPVAAEADKAVDGMRQELSKGIILSYSGYSVAGHYPDNDDVFVINATSGKKLLILNFRLANTNEMDVAVDMVKANPHFQVLLNGTNVGYTNVTMLANDLSSYKGTLPAGAKLSMVLIKQMDASKLKNVDSLGLIGDMGSETIQFNLE